MLKQVLRKSKYQHFFDLNHKVDFAISKTHSNTKKKLEALELPNPNDKVVLDVGCNFGFFSCYLARQGAKHVIGLDADLNNIANANYIANHGYKIDNVSFFPIPFYEYIRKEKPRVDIIIALSVLHYFKDIDKFFKYANQILNPGGSVLIELPVNNVENKTIFNPGRGNFPDMFIHSSHIVAKGGESNIGPCAFCKPSNLPGRWVYKFLKPYEVKNAACQNS